MRREDWQRALDEGRAWTETEAARALAACAASGMKMAAFARACGGTAGRFQYWSRRLAGKGAADGLVRLLPVKVVQSGARFVPQDARVVLTDGRLRVEMEGMSPEWLATLIRLVRELDG